MKRGYATTTSNSLAVAVGVTDGVDVGLAGIAVALGGGMVAVTGATVVGTGVGDVSQSPPHPPTRPAVNAAASKARTFAFIGPHSPLAERPLSAVETDLNFFQIKAN